MTTIADGLRFHADLALEHDPGDDTVRVPLEAIRWGAAILEKMQAALELIADGGVPRLPNDPESFKRFMSAAEMQEIAKTALK